MLERIAADTLFEEGQLVRISAETPREYDNYLYVVDREVYKDSRGERLGEPLLIFPGRSTPSGGNVMSGAGASTFPRMAIQSLTSLCSVVAVTTSAKCCSSSSARSLCL